MSNIISFRLEWKPGDYCFYSLEMYMNEIYAQSARVWGLYSTPQPGCSKEIVVYKGRHFVEPKYVQPNRDLSDFTPLYLGPVINEPVLDKAIDYLFYSNIIN